MIYIRRTEKNKFILNHFRLLGSGRGGGGGSGGVTDVDIAVWSGWWRRGERYLEGDCCKAYANKHENKNNKGQVNEYSKTRLK